MQQHREQLWRCPTTVMMMIDDHSDHSGLNYADFSRASATTIARSTSTDEAALLSTAPSGCRRGYQWEQREGRDLIVRGPTSHQTVTRRTTRMRTRTRTTTTTTTTTTATTTTRRRRFCVAVSRRRHRSTGLPWGRRPYCGGASSPPSGGSRGGSFGQQQQQQRRDSSSSSGGGGGGRELLSF